MSPNTYFYNRDEQSRQYLISEIRGLYAFIFNEIVQLYKFYYPNEKGLSTKADDVGRLIRTLYERHDIDEYLVDNFDSVMRQYPTMLAGELAKEKDVVGILKQNERLSNLKQLLQLYVADLSEEIGDVIKARDDYDKKELIRKYFS